MQDNNESSGLRSDEGRYNPSSIMEGLRERLLPFGWFNELPDGGVRFVTDHSGSVPLYYAQDQGRVFAGGTPLEVAKKMANPKIDSVSAADFLLNGTVCYPHTLFEGVYVLPPGAVTDVNSADISSIVYYRPEEQKSNESVETWGEMLREEVQKALLAGLDGKEKVKVLFSGGEDSRAILSLLPRDNDCELITFADGYNREVRLAERAAQALGYPLRFIKRPAGFYRQNIAERVRAIGGAFDIRHTHVWGALSEPLSKADAVVGGYAADTLFKSAWMGNVVRSRRRLMPERLLAATSSGPVGIESAGAVEWLSRDVAAEVTNRRLSHHDRIREFRPLTADNWHTLWPLGTQRVTYAHYLAAQQACPCVIEPFLAPQVYSLAARMPDEMRVDRKAFRAAFGRAMGKAGWLPTSSGRIPRLGGHLGHWVELGSIASRLGSDRTANAITRTTGRKPINQGAWSSDHGAFRQNFGQQLAPEQLELLNTVLTEILTTREWGMFFEPGGGTAPDIVRNRALQLGYLLDV